MPLLPKPSARMFVFIVLGCCASIYVALVSLLWVFQERLIFPTHMVGEASYDLPASTERLELVTDTGATIYGNLVPARSGPPRALVIGFAGNAWQADDCAVFLSHRLPDYDVAVFHYRGYAPSEGEPGEAAFFSDALLIHDALEERLEPKKTIAIGLSIGSGVAAYLAKQRPLNGLLLVTPFDSVAAVAKERFFWAPVRHMLRHPFDSAKHLQGVDTPTAVIIAGDDTIVPRPHTEALIAGLENVVLTETIPGESHAGLYHNGALDTLLSQIVDTVAQASAR
ncbi:MAG: alpha/beta hydrolase [Pseudomonadota bacterium]